MLEGGTFSALVDDVIARSNRKDRIADIVAYARSTMRECLVKANFQASLVEDTLTVDASPFIWKRPDLLQVFTAVKYPGVTNHGLPIFAKERKPGIGQHKGSKDYFYLSGDSYIFNNLQVGQTIDIAYLTYFGRLAYYTNTADRPARYDIETGLWTYAQAYSTSQQQMDIAIGMVTNWMVFRWYDLLLEGTLTKIYKTVGDERSKSSYALFKQQQNDLLKAESLVTLDGR